MLGFRRRPAAFVSPDYHVLNPLDSPRCLDRDTKKGRLEMRRPFQIGGGAAHRVSRPPLHILPLFLSVDYCPKVAFS